MTQRELMNAIINHEPITEEMVKTAKSIIEHMNKANESKKSKTSEKRATEIAPIIEKINTFLNGKEFLRQRLQSIARHQYQKLHQFLRVWRISRYQKLRLRVRVLERHIRLDS